MKPSSKLEKILRRAEKFIPKKLYRSAQPFYHWLLALTGALLYGFPSRKIFIVAVTGTKGKTTTAEVVNSILENAGHKTALSSTLRMKVGDKSSRNLFKMTTPGRFFLNKFLKDAVDKKCDYAVLEMTSEAAKQYRHHFIDINTLIFTNIAPEHIESHGSFENYVNAKLSIAEQVVKSRRRPRTIIANTDDEYGKKFLSYNIEKNIEYSLKNAEPYQLQKDHSVFSFAGLSIHTHLPGKFNLYNILGAAHFARSQNISAENIKKGVESLHLVDGRMEKVDADQNFDVIVDYAHTPDSLEAVYESFSKQKKICVLGSTGGGRDTWKRPKMGEIADKHCDRIILTDEDPYDENPEKIIQEVMGGIKNKKKVEIEIDRRKAMAKAFRLAKKGDVVLITGKGTDPYIMRANGKKETWSDKDIALEELKKVLLVK